MNFMYKLLNGQIDEIVHKQFRRFGKGRFEKRAMVFIRIRKNVKIKTSFEYCNDFVELFVRRALGRISVSGFVSGGRDFSDKSGYKFKECSRRMGSYKGELEPFETDCAGLGRFYDEFKDDFMLLNIVADNCSLKCKSTLPKPGKESVKKSGEAKINFCVADFDDVSVVGEFAFDVDVKKDCEIIHIYVIDEIVAPDGISDAADVRLLAKRKGKIIRIVNVDGKEIVKEYELEA